MSSSKLLTINSPAELESWRKTLRKKNDPNKIEVNVCIGTHCAEKGSRKIYDLFQEAAKTSKGKIIVTTKCVGCHGFCENGPIVQIQPKNIYYQKVQESDVEDIVSETLRKDIVIERLLFKDPQTEKIIQQQKDIPFYQLQKRVVLAQNGIINPTNIEDYIIAGGYLAVGKALKSMNQEDIIDEVFKSGLRGRGGSGFLTGEKWRACYQAKITKKSNRFVICNGDEGDPGAYMDRSIMEGNPHSILAGMIIGAYALGASLGYIYVRNEYSLAVNHLQQAITQAGEYGLLGQNILGSDFSFDILINRGGGAFVCGESSAVIASLEGKSGEPKDTYIHLSESGLHGQPTIVNNVETWANIAPIIENGSEWFSSIGSKNSTGTKIFNLLGAVVNPGLIEIPMDMTIHEIIHDIGGGVTVGKTLKAVQTGGPSGGCIPAEFLHKPANFEELTKLGSMMGSGGIKVMDEDICMVKVAKNCLEFLKQESCGKCTPCREGISQMLHILEQISKGKGESHYLEKLKTLSELIKDTSICTLGKTSINPVLSTIHYFESEYLSHIQEQRCPAKECKGLFDYEVAPDLCKGCRICKKNCPVEAISGDKKVPHIIDQEKCTHCGICYEKCPFNSIKKV